MPNTRHATPHPTRPRRAATGLFAIGRSSIAPAAGVALALALNACAPHADEAAASSNEPVDRAAATEAAEETIVADTGAQSDDADTPSASPPPAIQAWMDRLTVEHTYDPATGFIVAQETITLPPLIVNGPSLDEAVRDAGEQIVVVFATADRCAPCQQYKRDALNNEAVIARLAELGVVVTHIEVDQEPDAAERYLGSKAIPMTYALRQGTKLTELRGQRSADELLAWLDALPQS